MGRAVEERERGLVRSERLAAVGKMAAMITHEVRNPLSSIGLNTELLEDELGDAPPGEAKQLCTAIHREVDRLTAITEEYLAFSRLPKPKIAREPGATAGEGRSTRPGANGSRLSTAPRK
jgi:signal transduction histidine kinase